jgi:hypothetical protein
MITRKKGSNDQECEVGYGRPPVHSRFCKGQSGNPGGRPRGLTAGRAKAMALKEAYRLVTVKTGDKTTKLPALQVILRGQITLAAKGNGPAQRAVIEAVQAIEREAAAQAMAETKEKADEPALSNIEVARRIAFVLECGKRELESQKCEGSKREE